jgi:hypothetical protein
MCRDQYWLIDNINIVRLSFSLRKISHSSENLCNVKRKTYGGRRHSLALSNLKVSNSNPTSSAARSAV